MQNAPENPTVVVGNHFATLPTYVVPSFCACLQPVVSLGPPEGATTHHKNDGVGPEYIALIRGDGTMILKIENCTDSRRGL